MAHDISTSQVEEKEETINYSKSDSSLLNDTVDENLEMVKNELLPKNIENNDDGAGILSKENVDFSRPELLVQVELEDIKGKSENIDLLKDEKKVKDYHNNSELSNPDEQHVDNIKMEPTEDYTDNLDYSDYSMIYDANNEEYDYYEDDVKTEMNDQEFNEDLDNSIYASAEDYSQDFPAAAGSGNDISDENSSNGHHCDFCGKSFVYEGSLNNHIEKCHKFKCDNCEKTFKQLKALERHVKIKHEKIKDHKCEECGKAFLYILSLNDHISCVHEGKEKNQKCSKCDKAFYTVQRLQNHVRLVHERPKNYGKHKCDICGKLLSYDHVLRKHIRFQHHGIKDFMCEIPGCEKGFYQRSDLKNHIKIIHEGVKEHTCDCKFKKDSIIVVVPTPNILNFPLILVVHSTLILSSIFRLWQSIWTNGRLEASLKVCSPKN